jgi:hypothetical protein
MNESVKIRKIFGKYQVEFHLFTGCFYCKIGDVEFRDESYNLLLRKIKHSNLMIIDEDVYFKEFSGFERKRVMRLEYFEGYFYRPHYRLQVKQYSDSISETFDPTEAAGYADLYEGKYLWREQRTNSDVDNDDIAFINGCHYIFEDITLMLRRQDPCTDYGLGLYAVSGDCISFEAIETKTDETC